MDLAERRGKLIQTLKLRSDPEWKYFNRQRCLAYPEHSIDKGTQWAVFE